MMTGEWRPVQSNDVLKELFSGKQGELCVNNTGAWRFEKQIIRGIHYIVVIPPSPMALQGVMTNFD
jgi:hypothetical protein